MLTKQKEYLTLTGRRIDLSNLTPEERRCLAVVLEKYRSHPDWTRFAAWWTKELAKFGVPHDSALFKACDDLEARLGITQGKASPPDYRHCLLALIEERFGSRYRFCKETGIDQGHLSRILAGRSDFSMESLARILRSLGASLVVKSDDALRESADPDTASRTLEAATQ